jgi:hypothetical protein
VISWEMVLILSIYAILQEKPWISLFSSLRYSLNSEKFTHIEMLFIILLDTEELSPILDSGLQVKLINLIAKDSYGLHQLLILKQPLISSKKSYRIVPEKSLAYSSMSHYKPRQEFICLLRDTSKAQLIILNKSKLLPLVMNLIQDWAESVKKVGALNGKTIHPIS